MRMRQSWLHILLLLVAVSLFVVACERPLPGGYNDLGTETDAPDVPVTVPEVDSDAYPASEPAPVDTVPAESEGYPAEAIVPAEGYPADEAAQPAEEPAGEAEQSEAGEQEQVEAPSGEATAPAEDTAAAEETPVENAQIPDTHTVVAGENLYRIGELYGISWLELAEANGITNPASLSIGQVLVIPKPGSSEAAAEATPEAGEESTGPVEETADTSAEESEQTLPTTYVVQAGDNLFRIGVNFGVDWTEIVAANGIVNNYIYPGQELIIPAPAGSDAALEEVPEATEEPSSEATDETDAGSETAEPVEAAPTGEEGTYLVQEGDTIYSVAFAQGITWTSLVEANGLESPYTLEVGQTLIIPAAGE
ncbi:MAG: LysM peptidoglycan-binding domain-containing protein [Candidatus Promineifilaceae bacterium]